MSVSEYSKFISVIIAVVSAALISYSLTQYVPGINGKDDEIAKMSQQIDDLNTKVHQMQTYTQYQNKTIGVYDERDIKEVASDISKISYRISLIEDNYNAIDDKMDIIESSIIENPDRALALITLRKDIDNLKNTREQDSEGLRREMDRLYDFNKWFLVLMFTLNLGVVGIFASHFLKKPEASLKTEQRSEKNIRP
jgi:mannitol-specific phosphotransferase system IIBC component